MKRIDTSLIIPITCLAFVICYSTAIAGGLTPYKVRDIAPGEASSYPEGMFAFNGSLLFAADDGLTGLELWITDGTDAGTVLVADINATAEFEGSYPNDFEVLGNRAYFNANDGENGAELWSTDGFNAELVKDINMTSLSFGSGNPQSLVRSNNLIYFVANDGTHGSEIWQTNGTNAGTTLVADLTLGTSGSAVSQLTEVADTLFFTAVTPAAGRELWRVASWGGAETLGDQVVGPGSSSPSVLAGVGSNLYFSAFDAFTGIGLWASDGTFAGTALVEDTSLGAGASQISHITDVGGVAYFQVFDVPSLTTQLWKSESPNAGAEMVAEIYPGRRVGMFELTDFNGTLFFAQGDDQVLQTSELWTSNGTTAGTAEIDFAPLAERLVIGELLAAADQLFFTAATFDGTNWSHGLYVSDGSAAGTQLVYTVEGLDEFSSTPFINGLTFTGTHLFFAAPTSLDVDSFAADFELFAISLAVPEPTSLSFLASFAACAFCLRRRSRNLVV